MGNPRHYTDDTALTCWLCNQEMGELCHVHDPALRRHLPDENGVAHGDDEQIEGWIIPIRAPSP
jgi:hypothetical protein